jgi:hypothetical protein
MPDLQKNPLHIYAPDVVRMLDGGGTAGSFEGKNPSHDVPIYYFLKDESKEPLSIEVLDGDGKVVRRYSSEEGDHERCRMANEDPRRPIELKYPETNEGLNLWYWNLRSENIRCIEDIALFAGFNGPRVLPGKYSARVKVSGYTQTVSFSVAADPRSRASDADYTAWGARLADVSTMMNDILGALQDVRTAREQIQALAKRYPDDASMQKAAADAATSIGEWESRITQLKHQTYEDEDAWETMLAGQLRYLLDVIDDTGPPVTDGALARLRDLQAEWATRQADLRTIVRDSIVPINAWAKQKGVDHVLVPGS